MHYFRKIASLILVVFVCGCSTSSPVILDTLDPVTGITITHIDDPIVFFRDRSGRAAYSSDLVSLGPIQTNRMGQFRYFLWFAVWSTIGNSQLADDQEGFEPIILFVDGEPLELASAGVTLNGIGATESVYVKPFASATEVYYEVTVDQLRLIAGTADIRLQSTGPEARTYEPWDSQASAHASL